MALMVAFFVAMVIGASTYLQAKDGGWFYGLGATIMMLAAIALSVPLPLESPAVGAVGALFWGGILCFVGTVAGSIGRKYTNPSRIAKYATLFGFLGMYAYIWVG